MLLKIIIFLTIGIQRLKKNSVILRKHCIEWPCDFYDVGELLTCYVVPETKYDALDDKDLKKCSSEFNINIPFRYFY